MKSFFTRSWKTTLCGLGMGAGNFLVLAPVANIRCLGSWINGDARHSYMVAGVVVVVASCVLLGIVSRDHNVSSEQAKGEK